MTLHKMYVINHIFKTICAPSEPVFYSHPKDDKICTEGEREENRGQPGWESTGCMLGKSCNLTMRERHSAQLHGPPSKQKGIWAQRLYPGEQYDRKFITYPMLGKNREYF